jgi:poly-gamma-glutamate synthesis protein (capsule biosynthesis protein)
MGRLLLVCACLFGSWLASVARADDFEVEPGFERLFDGKSFEGWEGNLRTFRVEDGAVVAGSLEYPIAHNEFLCTRREYGDFELRLEARLRGAGQNAGIQFRSRRVPNHFEVSGYQCDMGEMKDAPIWGWLYDESRRNKFLAQADPAKLKAVYKPGRWHDLKIRCTGSRIEIWVNDLQTVDYTEPDAGVARKGVIALQIHGGAPAEAYYRNIRIQRLGTPAEIAAEAAAPVAPERLQALDETANDIQLVYAGDIMLADKPGEAIERGIDPFQEFADIFSRADAAIGNLECVIATKGAPLPKPWTFRAKPQVIPVLKKHIDFVSLANNHTGDFGHEAFLEQLELLEKHQLPWFGGGRNCAEARKPWILNMKGCRIALLGYNEFKPRSFEAGPDWPGVAWSVDEQVVADIRAARTRHNADLVIPYMHWGWEGEPASPRQKQLARTMIDAGADAVIGGHPHVTQEVEYYQGKLIVYSLGNFVFDGFSEGPERIGWLLRLRLNARGVVAWDTVVAHMDAEGIPHLEKNTASPSGRAGSAKIDSTKALVDSPLTNWKR